MAPVLHSKKHSPPTGLRAKRPPCKDTSFLSKYKALPATADAQPDRFSTTPSRQKCPLASTSAASPPSSLLGPELAQPPRAASRAVPSLPAAETPRTGK